MADAREKTGTYHENEALEDNKHKFLTDSTVLVNLQSGDFFFLQRFGGLFLL